jgi:hypothetical protein
MRSLIAALILMAGSAAAQKVSVKGFLRDSSDAPLPSATVMLLNAADSSLVSFTSSDLEGRFEMRNVTRKDYLLKISYVGYESHYRLVYPGEGTLVDLGRVVLSEASRKLDEVIITAEKDPVKIKKDTIEFNASSFKTKQNAVVEDLLKKLPGVEVDNDGTIRAQGQQVQRVTVDGKAFFGSDPKMATRNLPADAIAKVQVFDKKSDQTTFTGIDDGQREKTINLELKEEKRKGAFGNSSLGIGNDSRFSARTNINKFRKGSQLSVLAMGNNVNDQGFSIEEYLNFNGGMQQLMSGRGQVRVEISDDNQNGLPLNSGNRPNGIMSSYAGGVNYNRDLTRNTEVSTSYFYNHLDHVLDRDLVRDDYFPGGQFTYKDITAQDNENNNHRINFVIDHKIDSLNSLKLTTSGSYNETESNVTSSSAFNNISGNLLNSSRSKSETTGSTKNIQTGLLWRHRFAKKGRTFSMNGQYSGAMSQRSGFLSSQIYNEQFGDSVISQKSFQDVSNHTYGLNASYTEPLGKRKYVELNYSCNETTNQFRRGVFDNDQRELSLNERLSTDYSSAFTYHRTGINFRLNGKKLNLTAGSSFQSAKLSGQLETTDVHTDRTFENLLPSARLNYSIAATKNLDFVYETSVQAPTIQQLQPATDNSDPMNLYSGNPDLRPAYFHQWRANYGAFNPLSMTNFFLFVDASLAQNAITYAQSVNGAGIRSSRPVNVSSASTIRSTASFGFPVEKLKSRMGISSTVRRQSGVALLNDAESNTTQQTLSLRIRWDVHLDDRFDVGLSANVSRNTSSFDVSYQEDQEYYNNVYQANINVNVTRRMTFNSELEYLSYENKTSSFRQTVPLLTVSISHFVLKGNAGELKLSVNNVLDRNIGVTQTTGINYLERSELNSLGRYVMVSFIYSLNKQLNPAGMRPRGSMIRIID